MSSAAVEASHRQAIEALRGGRLAEARAHVEAAIAQGGERAEFLALRAAILAQSGDLEGAERSLERVAQLMPGEARAHLELGSLRLQRGRAREAIGALQRALALDPRSARAQLLLAESHVATAEPEEAGRAYAAASRASPSSLRAALGAELWLPEVYADATHLERSRERYAAGLERLRERAPRFTFAGADEALAQASWTNFHLAYQGRDDRELQGRYGDFVAGVLERAAPELFAPLPRRARGGRLRVGFASHFLAEGTVGRYFGPWAASLDRRRIELFVYATNTAELPREVAARADTIRRLAPLTVAARARQIRADALDVLVYPEMGMHNATFVLGALRLAPVQCAAWGHPETTGHRNIDLFISCAEMEPPLASGSYRERLALLPGIGTRYDKPAVRPGGSRAAFGLPEGKTLYLVPQSLFKIHPDNDALLGEVLERDPAGVAIFLSSPQPATTRRFMERLRAALGRRGLDFDARVRFLERLAHERYLQVNALCDVMLDTLHWSGGNTSLDAIACGLPIVTCPGTLMRGRQSAAMLARLGLGHLVAADPVAYAEIAARLGANPGERSAIRARMQAASAEIFGREEALGALQDLLEEAAGRAG